MNWNDPDVRAWVCEQIGVEYNGLPLRHQHKRRFIALKNKQPFLEYPGPKPTKKENIMPVQTTSAKPPMPINSTSAEAALLTQYEAEISNIEQKRLRYKQAIADMDAELVQLRRRRNAFAKIVNPT